MNNYANMQDSEDQDAAEEEGDEDDEQQQQEGGDSTSSGDENNTAEDSSTDSSSNSAEDSTSSGINNSAGENSSTDSTSNEGEASTDWSASDSIATSRRLASSQSEIVQLVCCSLEMDCCSSGDSNSNSDAYTASSIFSSSGSSSSSSSSSSDSEFGTTLALYSGTYAHTEGSESILLDDSLLAVTDPSTNSLKMFSRNALDGDWALSDVLDMSSVSDMNMGSLKVQQGSAIALNGAYCSFSVVDSNTQDDDEDTAVERYVAVWKRSFYGIDATSSTLRVSSDWNHVQTLYQSDSSRIFGASLAFSNDALFVGSPAASAAASSSSDTSSSKSASYGKNGADEEDEGGESENGNEDREKEGEEEDEHQNEEDRGEDGHQEEDEKEEEGNEDNEANGMRLRNFYDSFYRALSKEKEAKSLRGSNEQTALDRYSSSWIGGSSKLRLSSATGNAPKNRVRALSSASSTGSTSTSTRGLVSVFGLVRSNNQAAWLSSSSSSSSSSRNKKNNNNNNNNNEQTATGSYMLMGMSLAGSDSVEAATSSRRLTTNPDSGDSNGENSEEELGSYGAAMTVLHDSLLVGAPGAFASDRYFPMHTILCSAL
jgi:hypothetical protein